MLGGELERVEAQANPLGERIEVGLRWRSSSARSRRDAAHAAGFQLSGDVVELRASPPERARPADATGLLGTPRG